MRADARMMQAAATGHMAAQQRRKKQRATPNQSAHQQQPQQQSARRPPLAFDRFTSRIFSCRLTVCFLVSPFPRFPSLLLSLAPPQTGLGFCRVAWVHCRSSGSPLPAPVEGTKKKQQQQSKLWKNEMAHTATRASCDFCESLCGVCGVCRDRISSPRLLR